MTELSASAPEVSTTVRRTWLPRPNTVGYHILLGAVAILILGPLGGITASYMNFSLGFFVGGQVLAGILGSTVTYGYGPEGRHGANYMQTMAASVAGMSAMGVLIQAMVWLGLPEPPAWQLVLYFLAVGMFGVGVGMLYTPVLVDRMQLTFPSGLAVANILRALTDVRLLKRSIAQLGTGMGLGFFGGFMTERIPFLSSIGTSTSTLGAGMIVGARIGIPAITVGLIGYYMTPWFREIGWIGPKDPFRKIGFIIALGTIMGAAIVDMTLILTEAVKKLRATTAGNMSPVAPTAHAELDDWKKTNSRRLLLWIVFWGAMIAIIATSLFGVPLLFAVFAIALVFVFLMVNGISLGISDSNPISSAFVVSVLLMAALGLDNPAVGLMAASILLVSTAVGGDMQQDRSTGWRLGTNRRMQFRYQVVGIIVGAVLAVVMAKLFMAAYPVLKVDTFSNPEARVEQWQSAMTYKFVGALRGLTQKGGPVVTALMIGIGIGLVTEALRKMLKKSRAYQALKSRGRVGYATDFAVDAIILPSPYASSFGGFVDLTTSLWFGGGGIFSSLYNSVSARIAKRKKAAASADDLPEDMSTMSLSGGGLIAGDAIAALVLGIIGLVSQLLLAG